MTYPRALTHVGITVSNIDAAVNWYEETLGCERIIGPMEVKHNGSHIGEVCKDIFGEKFEGCKICHIRTGNGVGIELFEFSTPETDEREVKDDYWKTGYFHICLVDPEIEAFAKRIADAGGKQRSKVWSIFEGEPFKAVYCEDPWGNLIEIYSHDTVLIYANR